MLLIESYRLSSFLGRYGLGKTLKTFSLLPGERTKIKITTYRRSEETLKQASSILDSTTDETQREFERTVLQEQTSQDNISKSFENHAEAEAEAKANWGWGSGSVSGRVELSGGVSGSSTAAREEFGKNMSNAVTHNAAKASARRDVQIDTTREIKIEAGEEMGVDRELENINVSRTLNFVFKQMNQEYVSLLHLVDVRVAFFDGRVESRHEVALPDLASLLEKHIVQDKRDAVFKAIGLELAKIVNYNGEAVEFVKWRSVKRTAAIRGPDGKQENLPIADEYLRVDPNFQSEYGTSPYSIKVPGVILSADRHVMRTDGIVVDAFLGQGDCLDAYSRGLQDQAVRERTIENDQKTVENSLKSLGVERLKEENDAAKHADERADDLYKLAKKMLDDSSAEKREFFLKILPYLSNLGSAAETAPDIQPNGKAVDSGLMAQPHQMHS